MPADRRPLEDTDPRKRRALGFSCQRCRVGKLRCDLEKPCSNCVARKVECVPQSRLGYKKYLYSFDPSSCLPQGPAAEEATSSSVASPGVCHRAAVPSEPPRPAGNRGRGGSKSSASGRLAGGPEQRTAEILEELAKGSADAYGSPQNLHNLNPEFLYRQCNSNSSTSAMEFHMFSALPATATVQQLLADLPPKPTAIGLTNVYFATAHPFYNVLHVPTIYKMLDEVYSSQERCTVSQLCLLYSLFSIGAYFWTLDQCSVGRSPREVKEMSERYRAIALRALSSSGFMRRPTLQILQSLLLLPLVLNNAGESETFRHLWGAIVRMAQTLELHKLPQNSEITPEQEVKKKTWWYIVATDWMDSLYGGARQGTYLIHASQMTTPPPSSVDDYSDGILTPAPPSVLTSMSYSLIRMKIADLTRTAVDTLGVRAASGELTRANYATVLKTDEDYRALLADIPFYMNLDPASRARAEPLEADHPYLNFQRIICNTGIHCMLIRLHRPLLVRANKDPTFAYSRTAALRSAHIVLSLYFARPAEEPLSRRLWVCVHHVFLAAVVLAVDLCVNAENDPHTVETARVVVNALERLEKAAEENALAVHSVGVLRGIINRWVSEFRTRVEAVVGRKLGLGDAVSGSEAGDAVAAGAGEAPGTGGKTAGKAGGDLFNIPGEPDWFGGGYEEGSTGADQWLFSEFVPFGNNF